MVSFRRVVLAVAVVSLASTVVSAGGSPSTGAAAVRHPVEAAFTALGPFATTHTVIIKGGSPEYELFYPRHYHALGFQSPIITWGNGTNAVPDMYSTLLSHFASYGFTVIATTLTNTGSGREIDAAARYLVAMDSTHGSVFNGHLNVHRVAAAGHSQGATGAVRVATSDPTLITSLMTFSLPASRWSGINSDCPVISDCEKDLSLVHQPTFLVSTHGLIDSIIASPATEKAYFGQVRGQAALGIIDRSGGVVADHSSLQNNASGGQPSGELGYSTAWLEYTLLGNRRAATAFTGTHPELTSNDNWPGSRTKKR